MCFQRAVHHTAIIRLIVRVESETYRELMQRKFDEKKKKNHCDVPGELRTAAVVSPAQLAERLSSFVRCFRRAAAALIVSQMCLH